MDLWDGRPFEHAISLVARGAEPTVLARIWRAQVREVFPFLNDVREAAIARHRHALEKSLAQEPLVRVFRNGRSRQVTQPEQMEASEIWNRLPQPLATAEAAFLRSCAWLRNQMAHNEAGAPDTIIRLSRYWEDNARDLDQERRGWDWPRCGQKLVVMVGPTCAGKST